MTAIQLPVGIIADNPNFPEPWDLIVAKAKIADSLGYHSIWLGETWGYELFTSLADLARETKQIRLAAGIANVYSRSPGVIAATAATLDERSGGRMILGLGSSGPQVIEHWHGVPFEKPLARIHEYVDIINMIMRREPLVYNGSLFHLERGFKLRFRPIRDHIPIYLASLTPKSIKQAGAVADGILPTYWPIHKLDVMRQELDAGSESAQRPAGSAEIAPYLTTAILLNEEYRDYARQLARAPIAWYIGRMGAFYADMLRRTGFPAEVDAVLEGWKSGPDAAAAGVSDAMLDATAIVGTPEEMANRLMEWRRAGVALPIISMPPGSAEDAEKALGALRDALAEKL